MNARSSDLFSSDLWARALESYGRDTHLSVKLFDVDARVVFGPIHPTPLFQLFENRNYDPGIFGKCVRSCLSQGTTRPAVIVTEVSGLAVVGTSLVLEDKIVGAAVGGYALVDFSQLADVQRLAKNADIDFAQLWQVTRAQKPIPRQRLTLSGELLQVLGDALLRENQRTRQYEQTVLKLQEVAKAKDESQQAARDSADRLRFMAESMPQKVFSATADGRREYVNPQWTDYTGARLEHATGWGWTRFLHPDDQEATVRGWKASLESGEPFESQNRFRRRDGTYRWHVSRAQAMRDPAGNIVMWIGSSTDIDDIKQAEEALKEADRRKNEFLALVSHELRTPLNAIFGWATMLLAGLVPPEKVSKAHATIHRNAQDQRRLIDDLLDISRIMTGHTQLHIQALDVVDVVEAALESIRPAAEAKGVSLQQLLGAPAGSMSGDRERLEQVLRNLLANAVKFTPQGGRVQITVELADWNVEITVSDTGQGIKAELLPYIFDRFRQGDSSISRQHGGLGLGLAIVREIVQLHGGTVAAESPGDGQGATFRVHLPRFMRHGETMREETSSAHLQGNGLSPFDCPPTLRGLRVLVVDDDQAALELLEAVFQQCGSEVKVAQSAECGLTEVRAWAPHLIVSDIGMPGMDGYVFIEQVRHQERGRERGQGRMIPAIALTAYDRQEDRVHALSVGYQAHLAKPVNLKELLTVAASLIGAFVERRTA